MMGTLKIENLIQEPETFYRLQNKYDRIISVLGGSQEVGRPILNDVDLIEITRKGLPKSVISTICNLLNISLEKMSGLIHLSHRTVQRKNDADLLSTYSTEQILEIAEVISRGIEVLGTLEGFTAWMHRDLRALNYQKPLDFLDTNYGTKLVRDILGRIEHGVY